MRSRSDYIFIIFCISIYSEHIWKTNITDNDEEDTMTFTLMKKYVFRPDLSNSLTGDEIITTLHPGKRIVKSISLKYS